MSPEKYTEDTIGQVLQSVNSIPSDITLIESKNLVLLYFQDFVCKKIIEGLLITIDLLLAKVIMVIIYFTIYTYISISFVKIICSVCKLQPFTFFTEKKKHLF